MQNLFVLGLLALIMASNDVGGCGSCRYLHSYIRLECVLALISMPLHSIFQICFLFLVMGLFQGQFPSCVKLLPTCESDIKVNV